MANTSTRLKTGMDGSNSGISRAERTEILKEQSKKKRIHNKQQSDISRVINENS